MLIFANYFDGKYARVRRMARFCFERKEDGIAEGYPILVMIGNELGLTPSSESGLN